VVAAERQTAASCRTDHSYSWLESIPSVMIVFEVLPRWGRKAVTESSQEQVRYQGQVRYEVDKQAKPDNEKRGGVTTPDQQPDLRPARTLSEGRPEAPAQPKPAPAAPAPASED